MSDLEQRIATLEAIEGDWKITGSAFHLTSTYITDVSNATVQMIFAGSTAPVEVDDITRQANQE